jgi:hypothetical protein
MTLVPVENLQRAMVCSVNLLLPPLRINLEALDSIATHLVCWHGAQNIDQFACANSGGEAAPYLHQIQPLVRI